MRVAKEKCNVAKKNERSKKKLRVAKKNARSKIKM